MQNGMVLDLCRDDVAALLLSRQRASENRHIVGFGSPARKNDFIGMRSDFLSDQLPRAVKPFPALPSKGMNA